MGTTWEELELRATTFIKNDLSLDWDKANRLPVFFNRMRAYMVEAIPKFNRPPEMLAKLAAYTAPQFESVSYTTVDGKDQTVDTGVTGATVFSAGIIEEDDFGDVQYVPVANAEYDAETGIVTLTGTFEAGSQVEIDLYTSGTFDADLNETEKGILAFAIYNRYEHRFDNDVLERQSKIRDSAFTTISEASQTQAGTARQREVDSQLYAMLRAYQDNVEYLAMSKYWKL
jgi:hypothetical protein